MIDRDRYIEYIPRFTDMPESCGYTIESVDTADAGTKGSIDKYEVMFDQDTGQVYFRLKKDAKVSTGEKHIFVITYNVTAGDGTLKVSTGKVRIPVTQGKVRLQPVGRKAFSNAFSMQKEEFAIRASNANGRKENTISATFRTVR